MALGTRQVRERGSASVVVAGAGGALLILLAAAMLLVAAVNAATRARAAADQAALAAADRLINPDVAAVGSSPDPCPAAATLAVANGARLLSCRVAGEEVEVRVAVRAGVPGLGDAVALSRAGGAPAGMGIMRE